MANCDDKGRREARECKKYRDDGHDECSRYEDHGYSACDRWDSECCDWFPCSWACKIVTWFCVAWVWVANVACVAWYWVAHLVCVAWVVIVYLACTVAEAVITALAAIVTAVESIAGWFLDVLAWFVDLVLSIPVIGRLIKSFWNAVLTIVWGIASAADAVITRNGSSATTLLQAARGVPTIARTLSNAIARQFPTRFPM